MKRGASIVGGAAGVVRLGVAGDAPFRRAGMAKNLAFVDEALR